MYCRYVFIIWQRRVCSCFQTKNWQSFISADGVLISMQNSDTETTSSLINIPTIIPNV